MPGQIEHVHDPEVQAKREGGLYWYRAVCKTCGAVITDWHL